MDLHNTNYWSFNPARYEEWGSIYPIFSFLFAKFTVPNYCASLASGFEFRDCDWVSPLVLIFIAGFSAILMGLPPYQGVRESPKLVISENNIAKIIFCATTLPLLYAIERGNYIIYALLFIAAARFFGESVLSALFMALAVNTKQYLLVLVIPLLLHGRWSYICVFSLFSVLLNFFALLIIEEPRYDLILKNMIGFSGGATGSQFEKLWNPVSIAAWWKVANFSTQIQNHLSAQYLDVLRGGLDMSLWLVKLISFISLGGIFFRRRDLDFDYISFAVILILIVNLDSVGGYSTVLLLPYIFTLRRRPMGRGLMLVFFLSLIPLEIPIGPAFHDASIAWLSGRKIDFDMAITLGAILRPILLLFLLVLVVFDIYGPKSKKIEKEIL